MTSAPPRPYAATAAAVTELYPELTRGAPVVVYTSWSREHADRMEATRGVVVRAARCGYVTVREGVYGTTCDYDPRDIEVVNVWGTPKRFIDADAFCPECENTNPHHYTNCPTRTGR